MDPSLERVLAEFKQYMSEEDEPFSHVVLYQTNPNNPRAVEQIVENAYHHLAHIPGILQYTFAPRHDSGRAVQGYKFDVGLNFIFENRQSAERYMAHPDHLEFVKFVLNGWMIEGSEQPTVADRKQEFMDAVLYAGKGKEHWCRDSAVPEREVVWADEQVYDF
jgi:hypothetical protein